MTIGLVRTTKPSGQPTALQTDRAVEASWQPRVRELLKTSAILNSDCDVIGYDLPAPTTPTGRAMVVDALTSVDALLMPAPRNAIRKALARLKISTKARAQDGDDQTLEQAVYLDEIAGYPHDIIDEACRDWARREIFWPSVSELVEECNKLVRWRRVTRRALERAVIETAEPI